MTSAIHPDLAAQVRHRPGCEAPILKRLNRSDGRQSLSCAVCGVAWRVPPKLRHLLYSDGVAPMTVNPPPTTPAMPPMPRYSLRCVRCDHTIRLHRPEPRIPLCDACKRYAEHAKAARAAEARMAESAVVGQRRAAAMN